MTAPFIFDRSFIWQPVMKSFVNVFFYQSAGVYHYLHTAHAVTIKYRKDVWNQVSKLQKKW
jgi:hypothetical protein